MIALRRALLVSALVAGSGASCAPRPPEGPDSKPCPCESKPKAEVPSEPDVSGASVATQPATVTLVAPTPTTPEARRPIVLDATEIVELESRETGRKYELWVALPPSFRTSPSRRYPTLYLLDGQWDLSLVRAVAGGLLFDRAAPEFVIVGITYGGDRPNYGVLRAEDYTPTRARGEDDQRLKGGDAGKFLEFIEKRVLPLTEAEYRSDPSRRILAGASFGGLFTLYALFEKPELFHTYLALSPAVGWDHRWIFRREADFHAAHPALDRRVWLSVGTDEWPRFTAAGKEFFEQFQAHAYRGAVVQVRYIEGEAHAGNKPEAYNRALRFAFGDVKSAPR